MGAGRSILLAFLSIILALSLFILGLFWSIHALLYPQIYENALADNNAYSLINFSQITGGDLIKLPAGGVEALVNGLLENSLSYLRGNSKTLNLTVEVNTEKLNSILLDGINSLPVCSQGTDPFASGEIPSCVPSGTNSSGFLNQILQKNNLTSIENQNVNLALVLGLKQSDTAKARSYITIYRYSFYGLMAFVIALAVLMFFISPSRTRWQGVVFLISGIIVLVSVTALLSFALQNIPSNLWGTNTLALISKEIVNTLSSRVKIYSLVIGIIGIVAFIVSFFIKKKAEKSGEQIASQ